MKEWFEDLIVRWFYRFDVQRGVTGKWWVCVKPPFREWCILGGDIYVSKNTALRRAEQLRKSGGWLLSALDY